MLQQLKLTDEPGRVDQQREHKNLSKDEAKLHLADAQLPLRRRMVDNFLLAEDAHELHDLDGPERSHQVRVHLLQ